MTAKEMQMLVSEYQKKEAEVQTCIQRLEATGGQVVENQRVLEELGRLESDAVVDRRVGPILVKQSHEEAQEHVKRRIDMMKEQEVELKKHFAKLQQEMPHLARRIQEAQKNTS